MFTGMVDAVGTVNSATESPAGLVLRIDCPYEDLVPGESVSVNGACLTVRNCEPRSFEVAAVSTTVERTAIGGWRAGKRVNLERALALGTRLGGHIVQGHVDGVGTVRRIARGGDTYVVSLLVGPATWQILVPLGSIAVDGVSLTVNNLPDRDIVDVSLVDYTLAHTTLAELAEGDEVHIEADIIAKHVARLMEPYTTFLRARAIR